MDDTKNDRIAQLRLEGWRGFPPPAAGQYNPNTITWAQVRHEIIAEMVRWVLVTHGDRPFVDLFRDGVWAVYECDGCGERRCGFANVQLASHPGCGEVVCIASGMTYARARSEHRSRQLPLGATVREELGLTPSECAECLRRFWSEVDQGRIPKRVDLTPGRTIRLLS